MSVDLIKGFLLAHNAPLEITNALEALRKQSFPLIAPEPRVSFLDDSLDALFKSESLSTRTKNCVKNLMDDISKDIEFKTIGDLLELTEAFILKTPNFGRKSLNELKAYVSPHKFGDYRTEIRYDWQSKKYMRLS